MSDEQIPEVDVVDSTAIELHQATPVSLFRTDDPVEVIEKASRIADALKAVVKDRGLITVINNREHPRVEAWQTLGSMLGVFPVKEWVRQIPWPEPVPEQLKAQHAQGRAFGYEASFRAQRADGSVVGGGEAACMRTESMWKGRDDYALRSMAQTRATSKALKAPLGFVMSLAGYETTPAEEMPSGHSDAPPVEPPQPVLPDASVQEVIAAIEQARMGAEWVRNQLISVGAKHVPDGQLKRSTIEQLTPEQAVELVAKCAGAREASA